MKNVITQKKHSSAAPGGSNFLVTIFHQDNHSWQGVIQWLDTGRKVHFRSELELMTLLQAAVQTQQNEELSFRSWEDDQTLKSVK